MKKIVLALITVISITACTKTTEYSISGQIEGEDLNGTTIYIAERIDRVWQAIDNVMIEDNKFTFTGENEDSRVVSLRYGYAANTNAQQFVLEPGNIKITIDSLGNILVTGTKQNKIFNAFNDAEADIFNRKTEAEKTAEERGLSVAEQEKEQQAFIDEYKALLVKYCTKYANTTVGRYLFTNLYYYLSVPEKEAIVSKFNKTTKLDERIQKIIAVLEVEKTVVAGNPFVDFTQIDTDDVELSLSSLMGKTDYVLVDFWASWCPPCIQSFPKLKTFYDTYKGTKIEILGVSLDDNEDNWKSAIEKHELPWLHVSDLKGWNNEAAGLYAVRSIPHTILIDKEGKIVGHNMSITGMEGLLQTKGN